MNDDHVIQLTLKKSRKIQLFEGFPHISCLFRGSKWVKVKGHTKNSIENDGIFPSPSWNVGVSTLRNLTFNSDVFSAPTNPPPTFQYGTRLGRHEFFLPIFLFLRLLLYSDLNLDGKCQPVINRSDSDSEC